jgi:ribosomal protein S18 acetylase RimI-like enzyme
MTFSSSDIVRIGNLAGGSSMRIRKATPDDSACCAAIHILARQEMRYLPKSHTTAEVHVWKREIVFAQQDVWVAEVDGQIVGYASLGNGFLTNLYVHPGHQRRGTGSELLAVVKTFARDGLELWTFQPNEGAIRFYERHGFRTLKITDGLDNEEHVPDRLMAWQPA